MSFNKGDSLLFPSISPHSFIPTANFDKTSSSVLVRQSLKVRSPRYDQPNSLISVARIPGSATGSCAIVCRPDVGLATKDACRICPLLESSFPVLHLKTTIPSSPQCVDRCLSRTLSAVVQCNSRTLDAMAATSGSGLAQGQICSGWSSGRYSLRNMHLETPHHVNERNDESSANPYYCDLR